MRGSSCGGGGRLAAAAGPLAPWRAPSRRGMRAQNPGVEPTHPCRPSTHAAAPRPPRALRTPPAAPRARLRLDVGSKPVPVALQALPGVALVHLPRLPRACQPGSRSGRVGCSGLAGPAARWHRHWQGGEGARDAAKEEPQRGAALTQLQHALHHALEVVDEGALVACICGCTPGAGKFWRVGHLAEHACMRMQAQRHAAHKAAQARQQTCMVSCMPAAVGGLTCNRPEAEDAGGAQGLQREMRGGLARSALTQPCPTLPPS